jgi:hypothetical protein
MKKCLALGFALAVTVSLLCIGYTAAKSYGTIYVYPDGTISPTNAPILVKGNVYRLLEDVYNSPIVLERNHIVFDGCGFTLEGNGTTVALNITCSDVTVQNVRTVNWDAGILGAYNNVTIQNCTLTSGGKGIAIYADNYQVLGNKVSGTKWGIRLQGSDALISGNWLVGNDIGIWLTQYDGSRHGVAITANTFETRGRYAIEIDVDGGFTVHHNNFVVPANQGALIVTSYLASPGDETQVVMSPWDDGAEGNYWSNYAQKYPNASEVGSTGVYDTAYVINIAPNITDRYPLAREIDVPPVVLPASSPTPSFTPSPTATPSSSSTQTPVATSTQSLSATPTSTEQPSPSPQQTNNPPVELYAAAGIAIIAIAAALILLRSRRKAA